MKILLFILLGYLVIANLGYALKHPEKTQTQLFLDLPKIVVYPFTFLNDTN